MKAYCLDAVSNLKFRDVDIPDLQEGWVLVQVMVAGICSSDIDRVYTKGTYHFPTIPGHEFSGLVVKAASSDSTWIGKRVGVFPLIPCMKCPQCLQKMYQRCSDYDYIGSRRDGAFAEYVTVPEWNLIELPDSLSYSVAALLEPVSVAQHAVRSVGDIAGKSCLIIGTGAIGFASALWGKHFGAEPTVLGRDESKKDIAVKIGVPLVCDVDVDHHYDIVIEAVGSNSSLRRSLDLVKDGGKVVLMGNPEGDMELSQRDYWKILRKEITLIGVWNSIYDSNNYSEWTYSLDMMSDHEPIFSNLISHHFSFTELIKGLELIKNRSQPYCKVVIKWNSPN